MSDPSSSSRFALITGGASGLGRAFCVRLARDGWQVAIVDVDLAGAEQTRQLVEQAGGQGRVESCDVSDLAAWLALRERLQSAWPRLDLLVNNAGMYGSGHVGSLNLSDAERLIRLNLFGVLYGCDTMVPWLCAGQRPVFSSHDVVPPHDEEQEKRSAAGTIINVASSFAFLCPPGMAPYNLSKAAVVALSETLHGELRPKGVGVTVVCPGPMPTRFVERAQFDSPAFRRMTEAVVARSTLDPESVVRAALCAIERRQLYVVMGTDQRWYWRLKRLMPTTLLRRVARRVRKDLKSSGDLPSTR